MKERWINILGILSVIVIGLPSYAHAFDVGGYGELIGSLLIPLLVILIVFLILREIFCWYWKINETLSVLKEIRDLLKGNSPPATASKSDNLAPDTEEINDPKK